ncbi:helix-turn-helix transcriptional regulator [Clostridium baratii]|uniref:helix-turn-helix domain-containing protein n=1 Tax=Clostridium baratii TaxID=1561 RepID=UPI0030D1BEDC
MDTGEIIKQLRLQKGLTQEELGNLVGLKKAAINKYESGKVENIKRSTIQKFSEIFNVSPSTIMGWTSKEDLDIINSIEDNDVKEFIELFLQLDKETQGYIKGLVSKALKK